MCCSYSAADVISDCSYTEVVDPGRLVRDPLVSVVMITYNHEPYIAQAIEGALSQETDFAFELIIGEDCSSDRTREIVLDYQRRYPETIRVLISEANVGMHANDRRTMLAARGTYTAYCEGDDWWHRRDKLQLQVRALRADSGLVCVSGMVQSISPEGRILEPEKPDRGQPPIRVEYEDLIFAWVIQFSCTVVFRTDALHQALLGDTLCRDHTQLMGDLPLWLELSQKGRMARFPETLARYRLTPNSASRRSDPLWGWRFEISSLDTRYRVLERYPLPGDAGRTSSIQANFIRQILLRAMLVGDVAVARNQLRRWRGLGRKVGWRQAACLLLASIPLPRRSLTVLWRRKLAPSLENLGVHPRKYFAPELLGKISAKQ